MVSKTKEMNRWKKLTKLVEKRSDLFCEGQKPQDRKKKRLPTREQECCIYLNINNATQF